jgi:putative ABC transport system permease protein
MTGSFFKVAFRIFYKYRSYTLVNVFALAIGLASSIIIFLYAENEYSYDRFHQHAKEIYRIGIAGNVSGNRLNHAVHQPLALPCRETELHLVIGFDTVDTMISNNNIIFRRPFFEIFSFPLVSGNPELVLDRPESIVLSRKAAQRYFGNEIAIGRKLRVENDSTYYEVTGIMEDVPQNSHMHFDMVASLSTLYKYINRNTWVINNLYTYIQVAEGTKKDSLDKRIQSMVEKYVVPAYYQMLSMEANEVSGTEDRYEFVLQPLTDIHLKSDLEAEFEPGGNSQYVTIFSVLALLILVVACINFMNLATASTANRAKEVGIRKIAGSDKSILIQQFLTESMLITGLSLVMALLLVELLLPLFNNYIGLHLSLAQLATPKRFLALFILVAIVGIFAGFYPAFFLSSFNPIVVLRSWIRRGTGSSNLRTGLVFFQLFISVALLTMTFIVYAQFNFLTTKDLGFNKENLLLYAVPTDYKRISTITEALF